MALTKVRLPVADIEQISNGNSNVDIATSGANVIVTAGGNTSATFGSAANTLSQPTTVTNLDGVENIDLTVSAGATGVLEAISASLRLWTTSAHTLVLGANSTTGLTIRTDGRVALAVDGTAADDLVDKGYVDTQVGDAVATSDIEGTNTATGSLSIPNSSGNDIIINWGVTASIAAGSEGVTFDTAYPNAVFTAQATRIAGSGAQDTANVNNVTTTGMDVINTGSASSQVYWLAIGY